jgi:hypothetical protein
MNGEKRNMYGLLEGKPEGKRPIEGPGHRLVDNIKLDLGEIEWSDMDWICLSQHKGKWKVLVITVLNHQIP